MERCAVCAGSGLLLRDACPLCDGWAAPSLAEGAAEVLGRLARFQPEVIPGMDASLHYTAPHVPKKLWDGLGDLVAERERGAAGHRVDGDRWISLRLDGSGFSRATRALRRLGVLEPGGFSERFAQCMRGCLRHLMDEFGAVLGFTQSDEMVVFLRPASVVRGERQAHMYSGRVQKLTTLAAGIVTAKFVVGLAQLCSGEGCGLEGLAQVLPHFDCRLGWYESWEEARALLMWRAYDCSVNSVSDAVYRTEGSGERKAMMAKGKLEKTEWLWKQGLLPLNKHQAYGHLLVRSLKEKQGFNPQTQETTTSMRQVIEPLEGPVLELLRSGQLRDPASTS